MKEFWNERYANEEFVYGTSPNTYFAEKLTQISPGKLLLPCEGEGRNAVFAVKKGFEVYAFDQAEEGRNKALKLANLNHLNLEYQVCDIQEYFLKMKNLTL